jgi:hypothetical protein
MVHFFYIGAMNKFRNFVEWNAFGVCTAIGLRLGISTSKIRQYFMYSFYPDDGLPYYHLHGLGFLEKYAEVYLGGKAESMVLFVNSEW